MGQALVINASPRKKSNTQVLVDEAIKGIKKTKGAKTTVFRFAGKKINPNANFVLADILEPSQIKKIPKADLVIAFNVLDQYRDWKNVLKAICSLSNKYVNFSTLLRLEGETAIDEDISYARYGRHGKRVLWAVHNVFSLISYCATENINAHKIYVYCYSKPLVNSLLFKK